MEREYLFLGLALILIVAVLLKYAWPYIKPKPANSDIEKIIIPWAMLAVSSAYSTAQKYYDAKTPIDGEAKKAAAMWLYDRLPDEIGGYNTTVLKETVLTEELFSQMIEKSYRQAEALSLSYLGNNQGDWTIE